MNWKDLNKADEAKALVPALTPLQQKTLQFAGGDYWGVSGMDWAGTPIPADAANRDATIAELQNSFTPQPITEEVIEGYVNGIVGDEPSFEFTLDRSLGKKGDKQSGQELTEDEQATPQEEKLLGEVNAATGAWWDKRKAHETVQEFAENLVAASRASLRYFVPAGLLKDDGSLGTKDWEEALDSIYLEAPAPGSAAVALDRATMKPISVFIYQHTEKNAAGREETKERVEISFVNEAGMTVIRILEGDVIFEEGEAEQDTGGELYVDEVVLRKPIISDATLRQQKALNVINTMMLHNGNLAGFRERNYINLQRPQRKVVDDSTLGYHYEPDVPEIGPASANFLTGITYKDIDNNEKIANGQIVITDPVDPKPLIEAADRFERNIYQAVRQLHVMISGDAVASAVSRVQARADFIERLKKIKPKIEGVLRSRLRGAVLLACHLAGDRARLEAIKTQLRVNVNCRLSPGPLTPEERQAVIALYGAGIIPLETAQILIGIEDVDAEAQKLRAERDESLSLILDRAKIVRELTQGGAGIESAALVAGFSKEDAKKLAEGDFVMPVGKKPVGQDNKGDDEHGGTGTV